MQFYLNVYVMMKKRKKIVKGYFLFEDFFRDGGRDG